ncbi:MAG: copper amine oxidase N-terminal domain-containing protein [Oscillospiraceae bacterium]|nr:copper amine oxidase N-terminal domain-containing protein [Oscillospiraceae bacterium]
MLKQKLIAIGLITVMIPLCVNAADSVNIELNGEKMQLEQEPFINDGNTLVPMRAIFEALGAEVEWDGTERKIYSRKNDSMIELKIDSHEMYVYPNILMSSRDTVTLEKAPVIVDDFTYVPLRAVAEAFDAVVDWNGDTRTVSITTAQEPEDATENPAEPTAEPTETPIESSPEPTEAAAEPVEVADETSAYKKMYEGTGYVFERNIPVLTCDFEEDACGFEESQHCAWGKDSSGNGVLYVQKETREQETHSETELKLPYLSNYAEDEIIDISFDMYCPPSNGGSAFTVLGNNEFSIVTINVTGNSKKLSAIRSQDYKLEGINAMDYFSNNTQGNAEDINIENGAHVNVLLNPYGSKLTVTITSKSGNAEPIVVSEFIDRGTRLLGFKITADYYSNVKPVIVDNIVTNIVKKAE